jgi:hypothetical protein
MHNNQTTTRLLIYLVLTTFIFLEGCQSIGLTRTVPAEGQSPLFVAPTFQPTIKPQENESGTPAVGTTPQATCTDQLQWLYDLSIPDGSQVASGLILEKQWQVKNTGTCNWDGTYSIKLTAGDEMGAASPQQLVPARGGSEAVIQIQFVAPAEPGRYRSAWQAHNPAGQPFGDPIFIEIVITAP